MKVRIVAMLMVLGLMLISLTGCKNEVDHLIGIIDEMAAIAEDNKDDCEKMNEELGKYIEDNEDKIKEIQDKIKPDTKITSGQQEDFDKAVERFTTAAEKCPESAFILLGLIAPLAGE